MVFSVMAPLWLSRNAVSAASRPVAMRTSVWDIPEGEKLPANMPAVRVAPPAPRRGRATDIPAQFMLADTARGAGAVRER